MFTRYYVVTLKEHTHTHAHANTQKYILLNILNEHLYILNLLISRAGSSITFTAADMVATL